MKTISLVCFLDNFTGLVVEKVQDNTLFFQTIVSKEQPYIIILKFLEESGAVRIIGENERFIGIEILEDAKIPDKLDNIENFISFIRSARKKTSNSHDNLMPYPIEGCKANIFKLTDMINTKSPNIVLEIARSIKKLCKLQVPNDQDASFTDNQGTIYGEIAIPYTNELTNKELDILNILKNSGAIEYKINPKQPARWGGWKSAIPYNTLIITFNIPRDRLGVRINALFEAINIFNRTANYLNQQNNFLNPEFVGDLFKIDLNKNFILVVDNYAAIPDFIKNFLDKAKASGIIIQENNSFTIPVRELEKFDKIWTEYIGYYNQIRQALLSALLMKPAQDYDTSTPVFNPYVNFYLKDFNYGLDIFYELEKKGVIIIKKITPDLKLVEVCFNCNRPNLIDARRILSQNKLFILIDKFLAEKFNGTLIGKSIVLSKEVYNSNSTMVEKLVKNNILLIRRIEDKYILHVEYHYSILSYLEDLRLKIAQKSLLESDEYGGCYLALSKRLLRVDKESRARSNLSIAAQKEIEMREKQKDLSRYLKKFISSCSELTLTLDQKKMIYDYAQTIIGNDKINRLSIKNLNRLFYALIKLMYQPLGLNNSEFDKCFLQFKQAVLDVMCTEDKSEILQNPVLVECRKILSTIEPILIAIKRSDLPKYFQDKYSQQNPDFVMKLKPEDIIRIVQQNMTINFRTCMEEANTKIIMGH